MRIADSPAFIKGVVNLRGVISPIVGASTLMIVLNLAKATVGMVVNSVADVTTRSADQIRPAAGLGGAVNNDYIVGLGTLDRLIVAAVPAPQADGKQAGNVPVMTAKHMSLFG